MLIEMNPGPCYWQPPDGRTCSFRPQGKLVAVGPKEVFRRNPLVWTREGRRKGMLSARLFVGLNVGVTPMWTIDDVIGAVSRIRKAQGASPDASFLAQRGIYTSRKSGDVIVEDSLQVMVLNVDGQPRTAFVAGIEALAEDLARELKQEEIVVELQHAGLTLKTFGMAP